MQYFCASIQLMFLPLSLPLHIRPLAGSIQTVIAADDLSTTCWGQAHLYEPFPDVRGQRSDVPLPVSQLISRMAAKRPQDRPGWDNVLKILSDPAIEPSSPRHPAIQEAIQSALAKQQEQEKRTLEANRKANEYERQGQLYERSCKMLLEQFRPVVEQFNQEFQFGKITEGKDFGATYYSLPTGNSIEVSFFRPQTTRIRIRGGLVSGGGWIGLREGRSANLVLLREGDDDLYGRWLVCEVKLMALTNPRKIIGRFGITERTVQPFGFRDEYFYDQIQFAQGGLHVFTYDFSDNAVDYFANLIAEGSK